MRLSRRRGPAPRPRVDSAVAAAAVLASHQPEAYAPGVCACGCRFTPLHHALVLAKAGLLCEHEG